MTTLKPCPECGGALAVRRNRATGHEFLGCSRWPECRWTDELPLSLKLRLAGVATLPGFE